MRTISWSFVLLVACNGDGGDDSGTTPTVASCDSVITSPLTQVPSEQWPAGTPEAIDTYLGVSGRWEVQNSCGDPTAVKITIGSEELLQIVQTPWTEGVDCGCVADPIYDADSSYPVVALHENFRFYVETFDDPGVQGKTVEGAGALFGGSSPLSFRGCGTENIDPIDNSLNDTLTTVMRVDSSGIMSGQILLTTDAGEVTTCDLTNWTFVADE
jgi:hypothetical protein